MITLWKPGSSIFLIPLLALIARPNSAPGAEALERRPRTSAVTVSVTDRSVLEQGVARLGQEIESVRTNSPANPGLRELLPEVEIFHKAVQWPLYHHEFFRTNEPALAQRLLEEGRRRVAELREGRASWPTATGLVVRAYISKIDGSVQPYGLIVPASFRPGSSHRHRLDVWLHGRDDQLTELKFISDRMRSLGEFTPTDTFVLHAYGRRCNAFKFAGEVDVFEALEHARSQYPIDEGRVGVRGFSMGGAGTWHLAVHHPTIWTAAAPGAGFAETADYTKALTREPKPSWFEQRLWRLYDATGCALNLFNLPVLAYSGEIDKQKQAADLMARAMKTEGLELIHLIGPKTAHKYEPETKKELARQFDEIMAKGRDPRPRTLRFATPTLRYHRAAWLSVEGLEAHWEPARVDAEWDGGTAFKLAPRGVTALTLDAAALGLADRAITVDIGGSPLSGKAAAGLLRLEKRSEGWAVRPTDSAVRKRPGLQGPIDDAFMDRFLMVRPTAAGWSEATTKWIESALAQATNEWRTQMRGLVRVKDDAAVTDEDIASSHLVLWGDPASNRLLARLAARLPFTWSRDQLRWGGKEFAAPRHLPVLIYPNPLNPSRYVVLNSGFTFSDFAEASNALQTPKLPDYAVLDVEAPRAGRGPAGVVLAGFFDEQWQFKP